MFMWVDFRSFLLTEPERRSGSYHVLSTSSPHIDVYRKREMDLMKVCAQNKVLIRPGSAYKTEELGWYRVTFTMPRNALKTGLERICVSLEQFRKSLQ